MRRLLVLPIGLLLALGGAACSDDKDPVSGATTTTTEADSGTTSAPNDDNGTGTPGDTDGNESSSSSTTIDEADLPGERIDIYPYADAELGVIGVEADDALNVRTGPGTSYDIVTELDPLASGFTATGHNRSIDNESFWVQIDTGDHTGWVNVRFVSHLGATNDVTSQLEGEIVGDTMVDLAEVVTERLFGPAEEEGPPRRFVVVDGPTAGDLGEVTVDVTGFGDDALTGYRLHVFGTPGEGGGDAFFLKSVESTPLCTRGVSDEGLCL
jgi:uncharacterized protein YraI